MTEMPGIVAAGDVSVVVCTYDSGRRPLLERGLEALKHQVQPAGAVIVVVDHNPQLLGALRADHPHLTVVPNDGQRGLSGARNSGVALVGTPVVAFLDDDAVRAGLDRLPGPGLRGRGRVSRARRRRCDHSLLGRGEALVVPG